MILITRSAVIFPRIAGFFGLDYSLYRSARGHGPIQAASEIVHKFMCGGFDALTDESECQSAMTRVVDRGQFDLQTTDCRVYCRPFEGDWYHLWNFTDAVDAIFS